MASGSTRNLSQGHTEGKRWLRRSNRMILRDKSYCAALQALVNSIKTPSMSSSADSGNKLSTEQAEKISSKLDELLGNDVAGQALAEASQVKRNEKGVVCSLTCNDIYLSIYHGDCMGHFSCHF